MTLALVCISRTPLGMAMFRHARVKNGQRDAADIADLLRLQGSIRLAEGPSRTICSPLVIR
jgi:hypothetical protein